MTPLRLCTGKVLISILERKNLGLESTFINSVMLDLNSSLSGHKVSQID